MSTIFEVTEARIIKTKIFVPNVPTTLYVGSHLFIFIDIKYIASIGRVQYSMFLFVIEFLKSVRKFGQNIRSAPSTHTHKQI